MKKSLLALAAMGAFVGAAQAQSSVTVYGVIDKAVSSTTIKTTAAGVTTKVQTDTTVEAVTVAFLTKTTQQSALVFVVRKI